MKMRTLRVLLTLFIVAALPGILAYAEESCDHKGFGRYYEYEVDTDQEMRYASDPEDANSHLLTAYVIRIGEYCDGCGAYLNYISVGDVRTFRQAHVWTGEHGEVCACGAQNTCAHPNRIDRYEYSRADCAVQSFTSHTHTIAAKVSAHTIECESCGWYVYDENYNPQQKITVTESHIFNKNGSGVCAVCGSACVHTTADGKSAVADGICRLCGKRVSIPAEELFAYIVVDGKAIVQGLNDPPADGVLTVPSTLNGAQVAEIADYAFAWDESLRIVTLPEGLQRLGAFAFFECERLEEIALPASLNTIGASALDELPALTSISVSSGGASFKSVDGVLFTADGTKLLRCPQRKSGAYAVPSGVTAIADEAFMNCERLTAITLPNSLRQIGASAFNACTHLEQIIIPANTASVGESAFAYCRELERAQFLGSATLIGKSAFSDCHSLTEVVLPTRLANLGDYTFSDCWLLAPEGIQIPNGCSVSETAFINCPLMDAACQHKNAEADGVERWVLSIENRDAATHHVVYRTVTNYSCPDCGCVWGEAGDPVETDEAHHWIGEKCDVCGAINSCEHDYQIFWYDAQTESSELWSRQSYEHDKTEHWCTQRRLIYGYEEACTKCGNQRHVDLQPPRIIDANIREAHEYGVDGVCIVCGYACEHSFKDGVCTGCSAHEFVIVGGRLTDYLGSGAEVSVPDGVAYIDGAFNGIDSLVSVKLPDSVSGVSGAFCSCKNLESVVLPKNVSIGNDDAVFFGCPKLTVSLYKDTYAEAYCAANGIPYEYREHTHTISFEQSAYETTIGEGAIEIGVELTCGCKALDRELNWTAASGSLAAGTDHLHRLFTPAQSGVIGITADSETITSAETQIIVHDIKRLVLPTAITEIGEEAFMGTSAKEIVLPSGVTMIGARAFKGSASLKLVTLPAGLESIADDAFDGCNQVTLICANEAQAAYAARHEISYILRLSE